MTRWSEIGKHKTKSVDKSPARELKKTESIKNSEATLQTEQTIPRGIKIKERKRT